jgi:hypothetical protein
MDNMTISDFAAYHELTKEKHSGKWSENTALWSIVIVLIVLALMWYVNNQGREKSDLAASIQGLYGRVNAIEPAVTAQGHQLYAVNNVLSATTQAIGDFKTDAMRQLAALDGAVFAPKCGSSCGNNGTRFVKKDNYCLSDSSLQAIDTCG